jgi:hypothetical protein
LKAWKKLNWIEKIILLLVAPLLAVWLPELMLFVDIGGLEMAIGFLLIYYKQVLVRFQNRIKEVEDFCSVINQIIINSSLMKPRVFLTHSAYGLVAMWFTGALVFSFGFMMPALFVLGTSV